MFGIVPSKLKAALHPPGHTAPLSLKLNSMEAQAKAEARVQLLAKHVRHRNRAVRARALVLLAIKLAGSILCRNDTSTQYTAAPVYQVVYLP
jgi:hypothetical protein